MNKLQCWFAPAPALCQWYTTPSYIEKTFTQVILEYSDNVSDAADGFAFFKQCLELQVYHLGIMVYNFTMDTTAISLLNNNAKGLMIKCAYFPFFSLNWMHSYISLV